MITENQFQALGFKRNYLPSEIVYQFIDDGSKTNLFFIKDEYRPSHFRIGDGRPTVNHQFWEGEIQTLPELLSLLIRFGGNCENQNVRREV